MLIEEMKKIEKAQKKLQKDKQRVIKLTQSVIAMPWTEPLPPEPPSVKLLPHPHSCFPNSFTVGSTAYRNEGRNQLVES